VAGSWLLQRFERDDFATDVMKPRLFSTRAEAKPPTCPIELDLEGGDDRARGTLEDFFCRMGHLDFGRSRRAGAVGNAVAEALAERWSMIRRQLSAASEGGGPVRLLVKHYPQVVGPGFTVTVQACVYTITDLYLDHILDNPACMEERGPMPGSLLRLRKTYRLDGETPRLIGAWVEASSDYRLGAGRPDYITWLGEPGLLEDPEREAHFEGLQAGRRWGLCWVDLARGETAPRILARSYQVRGGVARTSLLPAAWTRALLDLVERL